MVLKFRTPGRESSGHNVDAPVHARVCETYRRPGLHHHGRRERPNLPQTLSTVTAGRCASAEYAIARRARFA